MQLKHNVFGLLPDNKLLKEMSRANFSDSKYTREFSIGFEHYNKYFAFK
jgi:hypothetical protein